MKQATLIKHLDMTKNDMTRLMHPPIKEYTTLGYVKMTPKDTLLALKDYHVLKCRGLDIPLDRDSFQRKGLVLSSVEDADGLKGTLDELLENHELLRDCKHEPYSADVRKQLVNELLSPLRVFGGNMGEGNNAQIYSDVCHMLGYEISANKIKQISTIKEKRWYDELEEKRDARNYVPPLNPNAIVGGPVEGYELL